ncbi:MAG: hypothetical protein ACMG6H_07620 [Acidobacteriota bacterium]
MHKLVSIIEKVVCLLLARVCFSSRSLGIGAAIAICFVLTIAQFQSGVSSIQPESPGRALDTSKTATAILTIRDNRPITVNGTIATSGATILSGTAIDTPDGVAAAVNVGSLSAVDIAPGTTLTLAFAQKDALNVILVKGCASLHAQAGIMGEIHTPQGAAEKTDPNSGGTVTLCVPQSASWGAVNQAGSEGLFGLGKDAALAIIGGRVGATQGVALIGRGSNPGPSAP